MNQPNLNPLITYTLKFALSELSCGRCETAQQAIKDALASWSVPENPVSLPLQKPAVQTVNMIVQPNKPTLTNPLAPKEEIEQTVKVFEDVNKPLTRNTVRKDEVDYPSWEDISMKLVGTREQIENNLFRFLSQNAGIGYKFDHTVFPLMEATTIVQRLKREKDKDKATLPYHIYDFDCFQRLDKESGIVYVYVRFTPNDIPF